MRQLLIGQLLKGRIATFAPQNVNGRTQAVIPTVNIVEVTGSTNDDLLKAGKEGALHGYALAARRQTAGRGRRGHTWDSSAGNLLLSIILRPRVESDDLCGLAAVCGLAAIESLEERGLAAEIQLKWPNDLYARGKKLGGILVEAAKDSDGGYFAVAGIGINVAYTPPVVPDAGLPAVSLMDLNGTTPDLDELIASIHQGTVRRCDAWAEALADRRSEGPLGPILPEYLERLAWIGEKVVARSPAGAELARGVFTTVDTRGQAVLETPTGPKRFSFEAASLRPL